MKHLILIVLSAIVTMGCSEDKSERVDKANLEKLLARQRAEAEKTSSKKMDVNFNKKEVSSRSGGYARVQNDNLDVLVAGDKGIFWNGDRLAEPDVASRGGEVAISLNNRGDWIAVGNRSIYVKIKGEPTPQKIRTINVGSRNSHFAAHINENGDWIVAGDTSVVINGIKIISNDIPRNATRFEVSIDNNLFWNLYTNVGDVSGIFRPDTSENSDDES